MEEGTQIIVRELVQLIIDAAGFVLEAIWFDAEMNKMIVTVHTIRQEKCHYGICRQETKQYGKRRIKRQWRSFNTIPWKTYV